MIWKILLHRCSLHPYSFPSILFNVIALGFIHYVNSLWLRCKRIVDFLSRKFIPGMFERSSQTTDGANFLLFYPLPYPAPNKIVHWGYVRRIRDPSLLRHISSRHFHVQELMCGTGSVARSLIPVESDVSLRTERICIFFQELLEDSDVGGRVDLGDSINESQFNFAP